MSAILEKKNLVLLSLALSFAISFLLYGNTIRGQFVYDDWLFSDRSDLKHPSALLSVWGEPYVPDKPNLGIWRPVTMASFALNFIAFGSSTTSFHITNIILNSLVVWLLFLVILKLFDDWKLATLSALLFAFLPIHTEAVAYIKSRDELLSSVFILSAWLAFLRANASVLHRWKWLVLSSALVLLAMCSKEQALVAPAIFVLVDWVKNRSSIKKLFITFCYFIPTLLVYSATRFFVLKQYTFGKDDLYFSSNPLRQAPVFTGIWTAFKIAFIYISKIFIPIGLSATYTFNHLPLVSNPFLSFGTLAGILFLGGLLYLAFAKRFRFEPWAVGAMFFLVSYALISKFILRGGGEMIEEHWIYLPSAGLSMMAGYSFEKLYPFKKIFFYLAFSGLLAWYGYITITRNLVWLDGRHFFEVMAESSPKSIQGHINMATIYYNEGNLQRAKQEADLAYAIDPNNPNLLEFLGSYELSLGHLELAKQYLKQSFTVRPDFIDSRQLFALALAKQKKYQECLDGLAPYMLDNEQNLRFRFILALCYYKLGDRASAEKYFDWDPNKSWPEKIQLLEKW